MTENKEIPSIAYKKQKETFDHFKEMNKDVLKEARAETKRLKARKNKKLNWGNLVKSRCIHIECGEKLIKEMGYIKGKKGNKCILVCGNEKKHAGSGVFKIRCSKMLKLQKASKKM